MLSKLWYKINIHRCVFSMIPCRTFLWLFCATIICVGWQPTLAQRPNPVLNQVFPAGCQAGNSIEVSVSGSNLGTLTGLRTSDPDVTVEPLDKNKFRITVAKKNLYYRQSIDLRAVGSNGVSSPRTFEIGMLAEALEAEPNDNRETPTKISLNSVVNGRIKKGDVDCIQFEAKRGQTVIIECYAERIDSSLRALLEIYDVQGKRLARNLGFDGIDPMIPFIVPADGRYVIRLHDLVFGGSDDHIYRLHVHTGMRLSHRMPTVAQISTLKVNYIKWFAWNLNVATGISDKRIPRQFLKLPSTFEVQRSAAATSNLELKQSVSITDVEVISDNGNNNQIKTAQPTTIPCDISGQLIEGGEHDWYSIKVRRGEVIWFEGFGERIHSPVDLDISVLDENGKNELARFTDEVRNLGGTRFPTNHADPIGRWVAPDDGQYLMLVRSLTSSLAPNSRRRYRISLRRQVPSFRVVAVPRVDEPSGWNIVRGDRLVADLIAIRHRGQNDSIRVSAINLPHGIECEDVFIGPNTNRGQIVITANHQAEPLTFSLKLQATAAGVESQPVVGTTVIRKGRPNGWARTTQEIPVSILDKEIAETGVQVLANAHEQRSHDLYGMLKPRHAPGSVVDVAVQIDRKQPDHQAEVQLIAVELPDLIQNQTAVIPSSQSKGHVSFYLPPSLPEGQYSFVVQATTTVPDPKNSKKDKTVIVYSNPVTIDVKSPAFRVEVDPYAPRRIHRGETIQVKYSAKRINGFISKIHTEVMAPIKPKGLRVRGVSFVGQTDKGTLQIIANDDAPIGRQPFLRLFAVGVVEDEAVFQGSCFLNLEIVE